MGYLRTICFCFLVLGLLAGCSSSTPAPSASTTAAPATTPAPAAPALLPHFKCYVAAGAEPRGQFRVGMHDQFGPSSSAVGPPKFLCTPVEKTVERGEPLPVVGNADHLVCYVIAGLHKSTHPIQNQLDRQNLEVQNAQLLCVPTVKGKELPKGTAEKKD